MDYKITDNSKCGVIGYGSWWVALLLGLVTVGLVRQFVNIRLLSRWRKALQNGKSLPQKQTRPRLYYCAHAVEILALAVFFLHGVVFTMNTMAEMDLRPMEQSETFPFATIADFYPGCQVERQQGILESEYTVWDDFLSPVNYDLNEYAEVTSEEESFHVYLSLNYHVLRWEWAAERLARELVSQSGANVVDQTFEKLTGGDPIFATELDVDGADYCVYFYRHRGSPPIILRSGTTVIRANLDALGEARALDTHQVAATILSQIQR